MPLKGDAKKEYDREYHRKKYDEKKELIKEKNRLRYWAMKETNAEYHAKPRGRPKKLKCEVPPPSPAPEAIDPFPTASFEISFSE